jgi:predicted O-methyltransferase YrrM
MTIERLNELSQRALMIGAGALRDPRPQSLKNLPWATDMGSAYCIFLYLLMQDMQPAHALELGTLRGLGACHMALGCPTSQVTTIDVRPQARYVPPNVTIVTGNTLDVYDQFADGSIDLLFIDTEHEPRHMLAEFVKYAPKVIKPGGVILFDDIMMGAMSQAWADIPEPKVMLPLHAHLGFGAYVTCHKPIADEAEI